MFMSKQKIVIYIIAFVLLLGNAFFGVNYFILKSEFKIVQNQVKTQRFNEKLINFFNLFLSKVLRAEGEVSFEERLRLENAVRDIGNKEILDQWQKFTDSKAEYQAQDNVKKLLELLIKNISY